MTDNQKDDIKMINSNHVNEVGGAEDDLNRKKYPDAQNHKLTGTPNGGGEFGGSDAIQNDVVRYVDFINGKGDYGTAGRDHSFALASLAIVNPVAAGAILGTVGLAAAIHGIATSTFVRTLQAKRRLNYIYRSAKGPKGYNPSGYYVALFGTSIFKSKDKDGSNSYGPKPFRKYYDKLIQKFNADVKSAGILDDNGKYKKDNREKNQEEMYATAGGFVASSIQQFYIPDSIVARQQSVYKGLQSNVTPGARYALTKEYGNLLNIMADAAARTNTTPLYSYVADQLKSLKEIGDSICEGFDRKMGHALKNGRYRASQSSQGLKKLWEKYIKEINAMYIEEINSLIKSPDYIKLRIQVEALSKVCKESEIVGELIDSLNVGGVFGRRTNNSYQIWKVTNNSVSWDRKAIIYPVNVVHLAGTAWNRKLPKSELFDRNKFVHYVEAPFSGDVKAKRIYKIGLTPAISSNMSNALFNVNDDTYVVVKDIIDSATVTTNRTQTNNVREIIYELVNFNGSLNVPQIAYIGGSLPESGFISAIQCEMVEDTTETQQVTGTQMLQPGTTGKVHDSVDEPYGVEKLNEEDGDNNQQSQDTNQNQGNSNNTDTNTDSVTDNSEEDSDPTPEYHDVESTEFTDYVYVLPGRYRFDAKAAEGEGNNLIVTVKEMVGGKVEYYNGDRKMGPISFDAWRKKAPQQIPSIPQNEEMVTLPGPPRDIPDQAGNHKYSEPNYPLTYADFYKRFLHTICDYEPVLKLHKDKLSEYGLYVKDSRIEGIYSRESKGVDDDFSMHIPYNFTPYIRSLGTTVLFESEEDFNKYKPAENVHESLVESFSRLIALNESAVNEESYDSKSVKNVKKNILDALQSKWVSIFTQKYDTEKQKEIVSDTTSKRDDILKKIDREAFDKIIEEYKVHVLTKTLKQTLGDTEYEDLVKKLDHIAKEGPNYHNVDRKANVNYDVIDKEKFLGSTYGRIQKNVENVPNFDDVAQKLADFNKDIQKKCAGLSKEDREKVKGATTESVKNTSTDSSKVQQDNSTKVDVNVNGDGNNTRVNNGDGNVTNNGDGNVTIVNNLNGVDISSLIEMLYGKESLQDIFGDTDIEKVDDGSDNPDTPVVKPKIVKVDDADLRNIILLTCAHIISARVNAAKEEKKAADSILIEAMKDKKYEYYTFGVKEKDELVNNGDETKISLDTDDSKKLAKDVKEKFIVKDGRIFAKILTYDQREDLFTFSTEDGMYSIKGSDTIGLLNFEPAQQNTDDVVNGMLRDADLPTKGSVFEVQEDVLAELTKTDESTVNDSVYAAYRAVLKLYEDGDESSVNYIRVIVSEVKIDKGLFLTDASGKEHIVSIEKLKEYGVEKFNKACRSVRYRTSDDVKRDTKYVVDKDYFNNILAEKASSNNDNEQHIEKTEDERIIKVLFLNDDACFVRFKIVSTDKALSTPIWMLSYLYLDPSKLTKTTKDPNTEKEVEYNKDDMYIITNYNDVKDVIIEHANESSQEYAYYKLYGMHLNEDDTNKMVVMKIVNVKGNDVTFSLSTDNYVKTYTLTKEELTKFKLEKYDEKNSDEEAFNPNDYKELNSQAPYPVDDIQNLVKTLESYKQDVEKKKVLTQFIESNRQTITNSGITGANDDEIIDELIATAHKFSDEHEVAEGAEYNILYITSTSGRTQSPINSAVVHCDKKTDAALYFSVKDTKDKFFVPIEKLKAVYLYPIEEKKENPSVHESFGVTINRHQYALYKLYGGSLLEAVNINPSNPSMMSALVNMLVSFNKALSEQQQQQNQQQGQNQQQQTAASQQQQQEQSVQQRKQQEVQTTVGGDVPMTIASGKPVEMVDNQNANNKQ